MLDVRSALPDRIDLSFVDVEAFGPRGEALARFFGKGKPIFVEGKIEERFDFKTLRFKPTFVSGEFFGDHKLVEFLPHRGSIELIGFDHAIDGTIDVTCK